MIHQEFSKKWGTKDLALLSILRDVFASSHGRRFDFNTLQLITATESIQKDCGLDHDGVCVKVYRLLLSSLGQRVTDFLNTQYNSGDFFERSRVSGFTSAKRKGPIQPHQTRAILPLPAELSIIDAALAAEMRTLIDSVVATIGPSFFEGCRAKRQTLDLVFPLAMHLEKSLDNCSRGVVAQADLERYYDNVSPLKVYQWLVAKGFDKALAAMFLRLHTQPSVILKVSSCDITLSSRTKGVFTGSRSAVQAGRIPILDVTARRLHVWDQWSRQCNGVSFSLASYVDNLFTAAESASLAAAILEDAELHLIQYWGLRYGTDSMKILPAAGYRFEATERQSLHRWDVTTSMSCLGFVLQGTGAITDDFDDALHKAWGAFFANFGPGLLKASLVKRMSFLKASVLPIFGYKFSRWPWSKTIAGKLDAAQTHMIALLHPLSRQSGEDDQTYFTRRSLTAGRLATASGRWSHHWALAMQNWEAHVIRSHDPKAWSKPVYSHRGAEWLQIRRLTHSSGQTSRTNTRSLHARVAARFEESLAYARAIPKPLFSKNALQRFRESSAQMMNEYIFVSATG